MKYRECIKNPKWQSGVHRANRGLSLTDIQWHLNGTGIQNFKEKRDFYISPTPLEFLDMRFD